MTEITITLPDDRMARLVEIAKRLKVHPEELVRFGVEELLSKSDAQFQEAAEYILKKNSELYRRLA